MGSLSLAGAIGGAGKGMQSNVEHNRTMEAADLDRNHDMTLERMRSKSAEKAATTRSEHELGMAGVRSEHELGMADTASERAINLQAGSIEGQEGIAAGDRTSRETIATGRDETSRFTALVGAYTSRTKSQGISTAGGWSVKVSDGPQSFDENGNVVNGPPVLIATRGSSSWQQKGDKMFRAGGSTDPKRAFKSVDDERFVVDILMSNLGDKKVEQDFIDKYGYLPTRYFEALTMQSGGLQEFLREFDREPAYDMSGGATGGGKEQSASPSESPGRLTEAESLSGVSIKPHPRKPVSPDPVSDPYAGYDSIEGIGNWWDKKQLQGAKASEDFLKQQAGNQ